MTLKPDDLLATHEITSVIHRYCRAMDRIDPELGYTVWHKDGIADYGGIFQGAGREFVDWVCEFHRTLRSHSHLVANILIDVDGDRAASETYVDAVLLEANGERFNLRCSRGRYLDRWSLRNGVWAIDHRTYLLDLLTTREAEDVVWGGSRDLTDPSYNILGRIAMA